MKKMPAFHDNCFSTFPRTQRHDGHAFYRCRPGRRPFGWAKAATVLLLMASAALLAGCYDASAAQREDEEALASRDFAARDVCKGQAFEWQGDVLTCFKELQ